MTNDIRTRLESVFREVFDDENLQLADTLDRESFEAWDSLGHIRLVSGIEESLGVTLTIDEIEGLTSVPQILALLATKT